MRARLLALAVLTALLLAAGTASAAPFAYITNAGSNSVSVIDTSTNSVVATIAVGNYPVGLAVDPMGTLVYVANVDGRSLSFIDARARWNFMSSEYLDKPAGIAAHPDRTRVYMAMHTSGEILVLDLSASSSTAINVGPSPFDVAIDRAGLRVYVTGSTSNRFTVIDAGTNSVIATLPLDSPAGLAVHPSGTLVYVGNASTNTVTVIDAADLSVVATIPVGRAPAGLVCSQDGTRVYVANAESNNVSIVDTRTNRVVTTVPVGVYPTGIDVTADGTRVYVANTASDTVSVIDVANNAVIATIPVGHSPFARGRFVAPAPEAAPTATVVEYYHAQFDHYFITWLPSEIAILDAGTQIRGWTRTGLTFLANSAPEPLSSPVCRYYIPPALGNSHFFGRGAVECAETGARHPSFVLESPTFMHMFLPLYGMCRYDQVPVFRVFSNRPDANHRYTIDQSVRDEMVARGWLAEGEGPGKVVMCAPR
jgi:YVTN family beta-propeller protein